VNRDSGLWLRIREELEQVPPPEPELDRVVRRARVRTIQRYAVGTVVALAAIAALVPLARLSPLALVDREQRPAEAPGAHRIDPRLTGIWWFVSGNRDAYTGGRFAFMYRFGADGSFALDWFGQLDSHPLAHGTYTVDGDAVAFITSRSQRCAATMSFRDEGELNLVFTEDHDLACAAGPGSDFNFVRVSPSTPQSERIRALADAEQGTPPVRINNRVQGIWLLEGTDVLLRIGFDGYAIADQGRLGTDPNDIGTIETDGDGTLTFTSGLESSTCAEGTVTRWGNVLVNEDALAADIPPDACGGLPEGRGSWVRISWP
jgi:hypothetical protein